MYDDVIRKIAIDDEKYLNAKGLGFTEIQSKILASKEFNVADLHDVAKPSLKVVPSLDLMSDMSKATELILDGMKANKKFAIVVDYDADGISSAAVVYRYFKNVFNYDLSNIEVIINKRENGNGIGPKLLDVILDQHKNSAIDIVITCDHGSANGISIEKMMEAGITVIVTDHHIVPKENSAMLADAFVNPQKDEDSPFKYISGCAVAYYLMKNIKEQGNFEDNKNEVSNTLSIVAISTIGDAMALNDPINRAIVSTGMREINSLRDPLWQAVKYCLDVNILMDEQTVGFSIVPAINAASRMGTPDAAFKFYISEEYRDAVINFESILNINDDRKKLQKHLIKNAMLQCINVENESSIVIVLSSGLGLNGIVSSNVGEKFNKPTVTFIKNGKTLNGSARGINKDFDLYKAFTNIASKDDSIFVKFGGHKGAAGCEIYADKVNEFKKLLNNEAKEQLKDSVESKVYEVIGEIDHHDLDESIVPEIASISPFGMRFERVLFVGVFELYKVMYVGRASEHVSLKLKLDTGSIVECFIFNSDDKFDHDLLVPGNKLKVVYRPIFNTFRGNVDFRLEVEYLDKF